MVDNSEKIQYPEYYSSNPTTSSGSHGSNSSSYQLAAEVPKKRTGRKVFKETRHPIYRGVRSRKGDKWVCELREPNTGTRIWLGTYTNPEMAARAHDVAALAFRGKSACLNFADSAWRLPVPASTDPSDVRRAAAEAAEMFNPGGETSSSSPATGKEDVDENGDDVYSYMEELDVVVEMPRLLSEMAEGMLLSSPTTSQDSSSSSNNESNIDWSQWNY